MKQTLFTKLIFGREKIASSRIYYARKINFDKVIQIIFNKQYFFFKIMEFCQLSFQALLLRSG